MLADKSVANDFMTMYKQLLWFLNAGNEPEGLFGYVALRNRLFEGSGKRQFHEIVGIEFVGCLERAVFGKFVFLKRYKDGYVFYNLDSGLYYQALGLNSPIEELAEEYSIVETAIFPFRDVLVCDGLIASQGVSLGRNMAQEIREGYWIARRSGELVRDA